MSANWSVIRATWRGGRSRGVEDSQTVGWAPAPGIFLAPRVGAHHSGHVLRSVLATGFAGVNQRRTMMWVLVRLPSERSTEGFNTMPQK